MTVLTIVKSDGTRAELVVPASGTLMEVLRFQGASGQFAECGGSCMCATCHVYVDAEDLAKLPPPSEMETALLEETAAPQTPQSRLSCQIELRPDLDRLTVRLPDRQI